MAASRSRGSGAAMYAKCATSAPIPRAKTIVRMLKLVLRFAVDEEWIEANSAARMPPLKIGEWRAWIDEECTQFEARWAPIP